MTLWLLIALPLVTGTTLLVTGHRADRVAPAAGVGAASLTLVPAVFAAVTRPEASAPLLAGLRIGLAVDGLSAGMGLTVALGLGGGVGFAGGAVGAREARARLHRPVLGFARAVLVTRPP